MLPTIDWQGDAVVMIDQRKLPVSEIYVSCKTAQEVASVIAAASKYVPPKHLYPCTNCGMAPMDRELAVKKLEALVAGTALAAKKLGKRARK